MIELRIVIAPDSFKGSLSAVEATEHIALGVRSIFADADILERPIADGGEGTVEAFVRAAGGELKQAPVTGPLGEPVMAQWGIIPIGPTAVIEMASASGLTLVPGYQRNPLITTTYGTGELISHALDYGCRRFIIGIGGSATNDGGAGMAQALGVRLLDEEGKDLPFGGASLSRLHRVDVTGLDPRVKESVFTVACDVDNPLVGPRGASAVYGPQKGATPEMVVTLDRALGHYAEVLRQQLSADICSLPGAGAAGGLGGGLVAFLGANLSRGITVVAQALRLDDTIKGADLVITGEGQVDGQTLFGKAVHGVAELARKHGVPVVVLGGAVLPSAEQLYDDFTVVVAQSIVNRPMSLEEAMANAGTLLTEAARNSMRLINAGLRMGSKL